MRWMGVCEVAYAEARAHPQQNMEAHVKIIDGIYPKLRIDLLMVKGVLNGALVRWLARELEVPPNMMVGARAPPPPPRAAAARASDAGGGGAVHCLPGRIVPAHRGARRRARDNDLARDAEGGEPARFCHGVRSQGAGGGSRRGRWREGRRRGRRASEAMR